MSTSRATDTADGGASQSKEEPKQKDVSISHAWLLMGGLTAVTTIVAFTRNKLAAVMLGPEGIGVYAQGVTLLTFATTLCTLGMGQGIIKHLAERQYEPLGGVTRTQIMRTALRVQLSVGLIVAGVVVALSKPLSHLLFGDVRSRGYVVIVGAAVPLTLLFTNFGYFLQGFKKITEFSIASAVNVVISLGVFLALIWLFGLNGAIVSLLFGAAVGIAVFWLLFQRAASAHVSRDHPMIEEKSSPHMLTVLLKYGTVVFVSGVLDTLSALLLRTWIINFRGAALNGIYQAVLGLSGQYLGFFALFNSAYLYPKLSSLQSPTETSTEINSALRTGLTLAVPLIAGIIIFRQQLILLLFTSEFLPAADVLMWQAVGDVLKITAWFISASLLPSGRLREFIGVSVIFSAVYIILSFSFLRKWNLTGLAVAYCVSYAFFIVLVTGVQIRLINLNFSTTTFVVILASGALLFGVVWLPNSTIFHYVMKVCLVTVWFFVLGGKRWVVSGLAAFFGAFVGARGATKFPDTATSEEGVLNSGSAAVEVSEPRSLAQSQIVGAVSVIVPVRNEAESIEQLIRALQAQTYRPAEIVITDGGSNDGTRQAIRKLQLNSAVPIILIEDADAFPGRGRNLAIKRAANEWLACVDAGIIPDPDWLSELVSSVEREPNKQVIYGRFQPITDSYFRECAAITYLPPPGTLTPSIASSLLRRSAWEAAGGFREDLRSGEDLLFFRQLETAGMSATSSERALVHWEIPGTTIATFRRFATYSRYGMKAGLGRNWQLSVIRLYLILLTLVASAWFWWPMGLLPPLVLMLRAQRRIYRWHKNEIAQSWAALLNPRRVLSVIWINFVIDVATFCGIGQWFRLDRAPTDR